MKAMFTLAVDHDGRPTIQIRHHDKSQELTQAVLAVFLRAAAEEGIELIPRGSYASSEGGNHDDYEIQIKR